MRANPCPASWPNDQDLDELGRTQEWHTCNRAASDHVLHHCACGAAAATVPEEAATVVRAAD